jgi:hypothetical protein
MRTLQIAVRAALAAAAVAGPAVAAQTAAAAGISVSATGSTVRVTTSACPDGGNASLLSSGQAIFAQGQQATLGAAGSAQSAVWSNVASGSHTVIVMCSDGTTAGTGTVSVAGGATSAPTTTTAPATSRPPTSPTTAAGASLGVQGGVGGSSDDHGALTLSVGSALVASALGGGVWYARRRGVRGPRS